MTIALVNTANVVNTTAGTSIVVNKPTSTASGHVMAAAIYATGAQTITPPSGWTLQASETGSASNRVWLYTKVAGGSEPSSYTWTLGTSGKNAGWIGTYSSVDTTTPLDAATNGTFSSNAATQATSLTIANANAVMLIAALGRHAFGAAQSMTSSDGTDTADMAQNTSTGSGSDLSCYVFRSTAQSTGAKTRTLTASATQQTFDYAAISLKAAAGAATARVYSAGLTAPVAHAAPALTARVYAAGLQVSAATASKTARLYAAGLIAPLPANHPGGSGIFVMVGGNLQEVALYVCANGQVQ